MQRRRLFATATLLAALLALTLTAPGAVAAGASPTTSPSGSPLPSPAASAGKGTPIVVGVIPNPETDFKNWSGDQVQVNFAPNGANVGANGELLPNGGLDLTKSQLFINGNEQQLSGEPRVIPVAPSQSTLVYTWDTAYKEGTYSFRAVMVTADGTVVEKTWSFGSEGAAGSGKLINFAAGRTWFWYIARGSIATVELTVISILFACVLALLGALGRLSKTMSFKQAWERYQSAGYMVRMVFGRIPYWAATFYTSLFRGTPLLLQIIAIYQVTPEIVRTVGLSQSYNPPPFWAGVAALSLNYGAYLSEVFRAGIQAVPKGQTEAAWALGLSGWQTRRRIILPQAFKIVIPAVGNDFIALIKDTSLVSVITVEELLRRAQLAGAATFSFFTMLLIAAAFYWALTIFFSFWQARLERRMEHDKAREV